MWVFKIVLGYGLLRIIEAMVVKAIKENYNNE